MNLTTIITSRSINIKEQSLFVAWAGVGVKAEDHIIFFGGGGYPHRWSKLRFTSKYRCIFNLTNRWYEKIYVLYEICLIIIFSYNKWMFDRLCVYRRTCQPDKENELRLKGELNTLTPKISLVILLIVCQTILITLVERIWYRIN